MPKLMNQVITPPNRGYSLTQVIQRVLAPTQRLLTACLLPLAACFLPSIAASQSISSDNSTGTVVNTSSPSIYEISGGTLSEDGANLFHSFSQFGLSAGEIANFISDPSIQNILGRVTGGNPSIINGLIQVTGGTSNVFLMNPAGIILGANAQLNVPGDFTATTATRIGLGNDRWFNAFGANDYAALVGNPSLFDFGISQTPGAIANTGNLTVSDGQSLSLLGGTVVNSGQLTAPGGNINIVAVPGENLVRISQTGHILTLEIQPSDAPTLGFNPLSLPELLTGSPAVQTATGLAINPTTGEVIFSSSGLTVPNSAGTVLTSGTLNASATSSSQLRGGVQILGYSVGFFGDILARGGLSGGFVQVLGIDSLTFDGKVDTSAANGNNGELLINAANLTLIDAPILSGTINSDSSPFDPNRLSNTLVWGELAELALKTNVVVQGRGEIAIADIIGNTPGVTENNLATLGSNAGNLTLRSTEGSITFQDTNDTLQTVGSAITLEAFDRITAGNFLTEGGAITLNAQTGSLSAGEINTSSVSGDGGNVVLNADTDITVGWINTQSLGNGTGGAIEITAGRFFRATDTFSDRNGNMTSLSSAGGVGGGAILIQHGVNYPSTAFTVGQQFDGVNGTAGTISTGSENQIRSGVYRGSYSQGTPPSDIQIITSDNEPLLQSNRLPPEILPSLRQESIPLTTDTSASDSLLQSQSDIIFERLEEYFTRQFENYLGSGIKPTNVTLTEAQDTLEQIETETGVKPALIYAIFVPATLPLEAIDGTQPKLGSDQLELVMITAQERPIRKRLTGVTRQDVLKVAQQFRATVTNPNNRRGYLSPGKQLDEWLVAPLEADLQAQGIKNLSFILDNGLRSIPLAALHNGEEFLIERYSISLMPNLRLTDTRYQDIRSSQVLAMGAETFADQNPLPAVPIELSVITSQLWQGKSFLNDGFTLDNLKTQRQQTPFGIIHLATHADFEPGTPENTYIQLSNGKLRLNQLRELGWSNPPVELLVLSACRTALGDEQVELGFAGLAVQAGVKSALASLWYVSDEATLGLMTEFYQQLKQTSIKTEALRQAQLAMLKGEVRLESGYLYNTQGSVLLPPALAELGNQSLAHPYYWAAFTTIGNPW